MRMPRLSRSTAAVALALGATACTSLRILRYREPDALEMSMFPKRQVRRADTPFQFARATTLRTDLDTVSVRAPNGRRIPWSTYMADHAVLAFLVIRHDTVIYETYRGGLTDTTVHNAFSVSKSILSALVGIALGEGKIRSLDDPIASYLPELRERPAFDGVTVRHLIDMKSGLRFTKTGNGPWSDFRSDDAWAYYTPNTAAWVQKIPRVEAPGTRWAYKDTDAELLGLVLSRATGQSVAAYMEEKLWKRIGTEHDASWNLDHDNGQEKTSSGLNAVARDYARFGRLYLNGGSWNGSQIVPADWVSRSVAVDPSRPEPEISNWWKMQHTLYWWHPIQPPAREFYADGSHGQRIYVDPATSTIIVQLANKSDQDFPFRRIVAYLNGTPWEYPRLIPGLVLQAGRQFGVDSVAVVFQRLTAEARRAPDRYNITRSAMNTVIRLLMEDEKTRAAGEVLRPLVEAYYR
jgi:CubicO group peptidase (beta-lactamase class C family)